MDALTAGVEDIRGLSPKDEYINLEDFEHFMSDSDWALRHKFWISGGYDQVGSIELLNRKMHVVLHNFEGYLANCWDYRSGNWQHSPISSPTCPVRSKPCYLLPSLFHQPSFTEVTISLRLLEDFEGRMYVYQPEECLLPSHKCLANFHLWPYSSAGH